MDICLTTVCLTRSLDNGQWVGSPHLIFWNLGTTMEFPGVYLDSSTHLSFLAQWQYILFTKLGDPLNQIPLLTKEYLSSSYPMTKSKKGCRCPSSGVYFSLSSHQSFKTIHCSFNLILIKLQTWFLARTHRGELGWYLTQCLRASVFLTENFICLS